MSRWTALLLATLLDAAAPARAADPAECAGFTVADAAPFLGAPAAQVTRRVEKVHKSLVTCAYAVGRAAPGIAFSLEFAPDARKAAEQMERYRDHLVTAGETAPYRGKLPKGAFSDIMGLGDEAVWTDVNDSLTVRKGSVTLQVTLPAAKTDKLRLAKAVVAKL